MYVVKPEITLLFPLATSQLLLFPRQEVAAPLGSVPPGPSSSLLHSAGIIQQSGFVLLLNLVSSPRHLSCCALFLSWALLFYFTITLMVVGMVCLFWLSCPTLCGRT